jgi:hypothetical protein
MSFQRLYSIFLLMSFILPWNHLNASNTGSSLNDFELQDLKKSSPRTQPVDTEEIATITQEINLHELEEDISPIDSFNLAATHQKQPTQENTLEQQDNEKVKANLNLRVVPQPPGFIPTLENKKKRCNAIQEREKEGLERVLPFVFRHFSHPDDFLGLAHSNVYFHNLCWGIFDPIKIARGYEEWLLAREEIPALTTHLVLRQCTFPPKVRLALGKLEYLVHVSVDTYKENEKYGGRPGLASLLLARPTITSLCLKGSKISPEYLVRLYPYFSSLTHLSLSEIPVDNDRALALSKSPLPLQWLNLWAKTLSAKEDKSGQACFPNGYIKFFSTLTSLRTLELKASWSTQSFMDLYLGKALEPLQSLRSLYVYNDGAGLGKKQALQIVKNRRTLRELKLHNFGDSNVEGIDDQVAQAIAEHNPDLVSLCLPNGIGCSTAIGPSGATSLAQLTTLRHLDLRGHRLESSDVIVLANNLTRLQALDLRNNYKEVSIGVTTFRRPAPLEMEAIEAICRLRRLKGLGISGNKVGDAEFVHLTKLVNLRELFFEENFSRAIVWKFATHPVTSEGLDQLMKSLPRLCYLTLSPAQTRGLDSQTQAHFWWYWSHVRKINRDLPENPYLTKGPVY